MDTKDAEIRRLKQRLALMSKRVDVLESEKAELEGELLDLRTAGANAARRASWGRR